MASLPNITGIDNENSGLMPETVQLHQNYPNPFNPSTTIEFSIPEAMNVTLEVFNMLGERVSLLVNETMTAGAHTIQWNASEVPSGIYTYRLTAGNQVSNRKMILLR
ncbi:MAG: T9SS type A sorting domain-containing protein [Nitrosopumilaceae archaeon]|nr:T9SS type A sorting domain-containing protein [Nitrosopumilaceae archaeon]NIV64741.1 T9SS type A sorting domain-containing protein [Nitrosopumilaceae archaeon]NIX61303.1 T9SS type A sorting domain-containing protein [Nitrosopumilaceae archaeon]